MNILEVKRLIEENSGPIVEVGGPALQGYELLKKHTIHLPNSVVVTNLTKELEVWNPDDDTFSMHTVDEVADIRQLPYDNNAIGMVLVSNLPIHPYDNTSLDEALAEYSHPDEPHNNYHLFLYKESSRVLKKGGLLIQINPREEDYAAASRYGLKKIYTETGRDVTLIFVKDATLTQEAIHALEVEKEIKPIQKAMILMVADGKKPATWQQIASEKWIEGSEETRITPERWQELNNIFDKLGLVSVIRTRLDDSTSCNLKMAHINGLNSRTYS